MTEEKRKRTKGVGILLHLSRYSRFQDDYVCPGATTQAGIADALGIGIGHVSVELRRLIAKKQVKFRRGHVGTSYINLKVYSLTHIGEAVVRQINEMDRANAVADAKANAGPKDAGTAGGDPREKATT